MVQGNPDKIDKKSKALSTSLPPFSKKFLVLYIYLVIGTWITLFDPFGRYYYEEVKIDERLYDYPLRLTKTDVSDPSKVFDIRLTMYSRTFSAQVPIRVDVTEVKQIEGEPYSNSLYLVFPRSSFADFVPSETDPPAPFYYYRGAWMSLGLAQNQTWYNHTGAHGGREILYALQGCYNIVVASNSTFFVNNSGFEPDCSELNIASVDAANTLKVNELIVKLTNNQLRLEYENWKLTNLIIVFTSFTIAFSILRHYFDDRPKQRQSPTS